MNNLPRKIKLFSFHNETRYTSLEPIEKSIKEILKNDDGTVHDS